MTALERTNAAARRAGIVLAVVCSLVGSGTLSASQSSAAGSTPAAIAAGQALDVPLGPDDDRLDRQWALETAADGTAWAAWNTRDGDTDRVLIARRDSGTGTWSAPAEIAAAPRAAGGRPLLEQLVLGRAGLPAVLWSVRSARGVLDELSVAEPQAGGVWSSTLLDRAPAGTPLSAGVGFAATADGTLLASWLSGERRGNGSEFRHVRTAERPPGEPWTQPRTLLDLAGSGLGVHTLAPPSGGALSTVAVAGHGQRLVRARWAAGSGWRVVRDEATGAVLDDDFDEFDGATPTLAPDGTLWSQEVERYGFGDVTGVRLQHWSADGDRLGRSRAVPRPTQAQTQGGWVGSGSVNVGEVTPLTTGETVVTYGLSGPNGESGRGVGSLWAATLSRAGTWRVAPVDRWSETTGASHADAALDAAGRLTLTWGSRVEQREGCRGTVFTATRRTDGSWTPRRLVGLRPAAPQACLDRPFRSSEPSPLLGWMDDRQLHLEPFTAPPRASASTGRVRLVTRTWAQVRRAGGIVVACPVRDARSVCAISALRAHRSLRVFENGAVTRAPRAPAAGLAACLASDAHAVVEPARPRVRLPSARGCVEHLTGEAVLGLTVALDQPGHRLTVQRLRVRIRR
ncbi:MAG: hypothetical protein PGN13_09325 [Patulibacter minatonensis]